MSEDSRSQSSEEKSYKSSLFVRNLADHIEADDLRTLCSKYSEVKDIYIPIDFHSNKRKGFAFIELFTTKDALKVLEKINGKEFKGSKLSVMVAKQGRKSATEMKKKERRVKKHFSSRSSSRSSSSESPRRRRKTHRKHQNKDRRSKRNRSQSSSSNSSEDSSRSRSRSQRKNKSKSSSSNEKSSSKSRNYSKSSKSSSSESKRSSSKSSEKKNNNNLKGEISENSSMD